MARPDREGKGYITGGCLLLKLISAQVLKMQIILQVKRDRPDPTEPWADCINGKDDGNPAQSAAGDAGCSRSAVCKIRG